MIFNVVVGLLSFAVIAVILRAWVLTVLWGWFLVPVGVFELSITTAIGVSIIVNLFTQHLAKDSSDEKGKPGMINGMIQAVFGPLIALLLGWIVTWFM